MATSNFIYGQNRQQSPGIQYSQFPTREPLGTGMNQQQYQSAYSSRPTGGTFPGSSGTSDYLHWQMNRFGGGGGGSTFGQGGFGSAQANASYGSRFGSGGGWVPQQIKSTTTTPVAPDMERPALGEEDRQAVISGTQWRTAAGRRALRRGLRETLLQGQGEENPAVRSMVARNALLGFSEGLGRLYTGARGQSEAAERRGREMEFQAGMQDYMRRFGSRTENQYAPVPYQTAGPGTGFGAGRLVDRLSNRAMGYGGGTYPPPATTAPYGSTYPYA